MYIEKLMEPSLDLIYLVRNEIRRNVQLCDAEMSIEWNRFPKLKVQIFDFMSKLVSSRIDIVRESVKSLIEAELAYINNRHPDFRKENAITPLVHHTQRVAGGHVNVQVLAGSMLSGTKGEEENCQVLQNLVKLFFEVVRKTVLDAVPKAIMFRMINYVVDNVETELFKNVYKADGFETLLDESNEISRKREHARTMLTALTRANKIIAEVYDDGDNGV